MRHPLHRCLYHPMSPPLSARFMGDESYASTRLIADGLNVHFREAPTPPRRRSPPANALMSSVRDGPPRHRLI